MSSACGAGSARARSGRGCVDLGGPRRREHEAGMLAVTRAVGDPAHVVTEAVRLQRRPREGDLATAEIVPGCRRCV